MCGVERERARAPRPCSRSFLKSPEQVPPSASTIRPVCMVVIIVIMIMIIFAITIIIIGIEGGREGGRAPVRQHHPPFVCVCVRERERESE